MPSVWSEPFSKQQQMHLLKAGKLAPLVDVNEEDQATPKKGKCLKINICSVPMDPEPETHALEVHFFQVQCSQTVP